MTEFPEVREEVVSWGRRTRTHCPNYKAIVNPDTGDTYCQSWVSTRET